MGGWREGGIDGQWEIKGGGDCLVLSAGYAAHSVGWTRSSVSPVILSSPPLLQGLTLKSFPFTLLSLSPFTRVFPWLPFAVLRDPLSLPYHSSCLLLLTSPQHRSFSFPSVGFFLLFRSLSLCPSVRLSLCHLQRLVWVSGIRRDRRHSVCQKSPSSNHMTQWDMADRCCCPETDSTEWETAKMSGGKRERGDGVQMCSVHVCMNDCVGLHCMCTWASSCIRWCSCMCTYCTSPLTASACAESLVLKSVCVPVSCVHAHVFVSFPKLHRVISSGSSSLNPLHSWTSHLIKKKTREAGAEERWIPELAASLQPRQQTTKPTLDFPLGLVWNNCFGIT